MCSIQDEAALREASERLTKLGIEHYMFEEDDMGDQATALATRPLDAAERKHMYHYRLWNNERRIAWTR